MSKSERWTHTATLACTYKAGAEQFYRFEHSNVHPGEVVELVQDPQQQEGDWITFRRAGGNTGIAFVGDLRDVKRVAK